MVAAVSIGAAVWMIDAANNSEVAYKHFSKNRAKADADRAGEYIARGCGPLTPPARSKCVADQYYAAHQAQHDDRDLEAQRTTAVWTRYLGIAGILGTAFGTIGVLLVLLTFRENKRAADAAHDANRPWIEGELPSDVDMELTSEGITLSADVGLVNHGNSPATNVLAQARLIAIPNSEQESESALTVSRSGIEAALDEWEKRHGGRGKIVYPGGKPEKTIVTTELNVARIREAEGNPPEPVLYLLAVGISYRFGDKLGRTVSTYLLRIKGHQRLLGSPYSISENVTSIVSGEQVDLTDTQEGFAT